jgi:hypothetical protein
MKLSQAAESLQPRRIDRKGCAFREQLLLNGIGKEVLQGDALMGGCGLRLAKEGVGDLDPWSSRTHFPIIMGPVVEASQNTASSVMAYPLPISFLRPELRAIRPVPVCRLRTRHTVPLAVFWVFPWG